MGWYVRDEDPICSLPVDASGVWLRCDLVIEVTVPMDIGVPATRLFAFISDFENNSTWQTGVESTEWTSSRPFGMGSTYQQRVGYRDMVTTYEVTAIDPGLNNHHIPERRDNSHVGYPGCPACRRVDPHHNARHDARAGYFHQ